MRIGRDDDIKSGHRHRPLRALVVVSLFAAVLVRATITAAQSAVPVIRPALEVTVVDPGSTGCQYLDGRPGAQWQELKAVKPLDVGQSVRTGDVTRVQLSAMERRLEMAPATQIEIHGATKQELTLFVVAGRLYSHHASSGGADARLVVETKFGVAVIQGTEWEIEVEKESGNTTLKVLAGKVELSNKPDGTSVTTKELKIVGAGQQATIAADGRLIVTKLTESSDRVQWVTSYALDTRRYESGRDLPAIAALSAIRGGDYQAAAAGLKRAIDAGRPLAAESFLLYADLMLTVGNLEAAREALDAGQRSHAADARFSAMRARIALIAGDVDASCKAIADAFAKDASSLDTLIVLGDVERRNGHATAAIAAYTRAVDAHPEDARGWFGLGAIASEREDIVRGRKFYAAARERDPSNPEYLYALGVHETLANDVDAANAAFKSALASGAADYVALTGRGLLQLKLGHDAAAIDDLMQATQIEPQYARAHAYLGVAFYRLGRIGEAGEQFDRAASLDPNDSLPHMLKSLMLTDQYRPAEALDAAVKAQALFPFLKSLNQLATSDRGSANIGNAVKFFGLEDWAQHLAQESNYPFWAGSHLFLSDRYKSPYAKDSEYVQGILADPTIFGASPWSQTLLPRKSVYPSASLFVGQPASGVRTRAVELSTNTYLLAPKPLGMTIDAVVPLVSTAQSRQPDGEWRVGYLQAGAGAALSPVFKTFLLGSYVEVAKAGRVSMNRTQLQAGASYALSPVSTISFKAGGSRDRTDERDLLEDSGFLFPREAGDPPACCAFLLDTQRWDAQVRHLFMVRDRHQIAYGGGVAGQRNAGVATYYGEQVPSSFTETSGSIFASDRVTFGSRGLTQVDVFVDHDSVKDPVSVEAPPAEWRVLPRAGAALPVGSQGTVRFAFQDWSRPRGQESTVGPVATVGIPLDETLMVSGGRIRRFRSQLEWQAGPRIFLSGGGEYQSVHSSIPRLFFGEQYIVEYLDQAERALRDKVASRFRDIGRDASRVAINNKSIEEGKPAIDDGHLWAADVSLNAIFTDRLSASLRYRAAASREDAGDLGTAPIPYTPSHLAVGGLTWVSPHRIYLFSQLVFRSERCFSHLSDEYVCPETIPAGVSGGGGGTWESKNRRFAVELTASDIGSQYWLPQVALAVKVRR